MFYTKTGLPISTGLPKGFSDLFGFTKRDGKVFFIEVKTEKGRPTNEQKQFIKSMQSHGVRAGIARSVSDAREILLSDE